MTDLAAAGSKLRQALVDEPMAALELLTILRLRRPPILAGATLGRSQAYFPAVGLLLGLAVYGAEQGFTPAVGAPLRGWLLVALLALLTGGLHLDGLADSVDGLFGGRTAESRLAIMRDSSIGAFGTCALIIVIGVKAASLTEISSGLRIEGLVLAPALARWAGVAGIVAFPYARDAGLGHSFHAFASIRSTVIAAAITLTAAVLLLGVLGFAVFIIVSLAALGLGLFITRLLGGLTGDSYGAMIECLETSVLVGFAAGVG